MQCEELYYGQIKLSCGKRFASIHCPSIVATFSGLVQPSVTHLDLSVRDLRLYRLKTATATERAFRRVVVPDAVATVDRLHLDSPLHFDGRLVRLAGTVTEWLLSASKDHASKDRHFLGDCIGAASYLYTSGFDLAIAERVKKSQNKTSDLRKYLKVLRTMKFESRPPLYEIFLDVLAEEQCEDSDLLLMEFLEISMGIRLSHCLLTFRNERRLNYVLSHTQSSSLDIFKHTGNINRSPVNTSILYGVPWNLQVFLKYGFSTEFPLSPVFFHPPRFVS